MSYAATALTLLTIHAYRTGYGQLVSHFPDPKDSIPNLLSPPSYHPITLGPPEWFYVFVPWPYPVHPAYTTAMEILANGRPVKDWDYQEIEGLQVAIKEGRFYFLRGDKWEQIWRGEQVVGVKMREDWVGNEAEEQQEGDEKKETEIDKTEVEETEQEEREKEETEVGEAEEEEDGQEEKKFLGTEDLGKGVICKKGVIGCDECRKVLDCEECMRTRAAGGGCGFWKEIKVCETTGEKKRLDIVEAI